MESYTRAIWSDRLNNKYKEVLKACAVAAKEAQNNFTITDVVNRSGLSKTTISRLIVGFCDPPRSILIERKGNGGRQYFYSFKDYSLVDYVLNLDKKKPSRPLRPNAP